MPEGGIEPPLPCGNRILSPARLPIPSLRQRGGANQQPDLASTPSTQTVLLRRDAAGREQELLEDVDVDGLHEVVVEAGLDGALAIAGLAVARQRDEERAVEGRVATHRARDGVAVHLG